VVRRDRNIFLTASGRPRDIHFEIYLFTLTFCATCALFYPQPAHCQNVHLKNC